MSKIADLTPHYELPYYLQMRRIFNTEGHSWDPLGPHIQDAIDDLPDDGGTVWLPRNLGLHITTPILGRGKSVRIEGLSCLASSPPWTMIVADTLGMAQMILFDGELSHLENVRLHGDEKALVGLDIRAKDCKMVNCAVIFCERGVSSLHENTHILRNFIEGNNLGVRMFNSGYSWIAHNTFHGNDDPLGGDIVLTGGPYDVHDNRSREASKFLVGEGNITRLISHDNMLEAGTDNCYHFLEDLINSVIHDDVVDGGGVTPSYLFTTADKTVANVRVHDSRVFGLTGNMFVEGAAGKVMKHRIDGYNPVGPIATPYPAAAGNIDDVASAQAHPSNNTNYTVVSSPKFITIYGGVVTSISIDGTVTGLTEGSFYLRPKQVFNVVWTGQPSSVVYAL